MWRSGGGSGGGVRVHVRDLAVDDPAAEALGATLRVVVGVAGAAPGLVGALVDGDIGSWNGKKNSSVRIAWGWGDRRGGH